MKCCICGKPVVLVPSAEERSKSSGYPASYYRQLFTSHSNCQLKERLKSDLELIRRVNNKTN